MSTPAQTAMTTWDAGARTAINTIRTLSIDAVQQAASFGASAPLMELQRRCGFAPEKVVAAAKALLGRS